MTLSTEEIHSRWSCNIIIICCSWRSLIFDECRVHLIITLKQTKDCKKYALFIAEHHCLLPADPINGHKNCSESDKAVYCTLTCIEGFAFAFQVREPPKTFLCLWHQVTFILSIHIIMCVHWYNQLHFFTHIFTIGMERVNPCLPSGLALY